MLQDVHVACKLLTRVQIAIRDDNDDGASNGPFSPAAATSATSSSPGDSTHGGSAANTKDGSHGWSGVAHGVRVSGTRRHPVLELSPHDLGFLDREHARSMGWRHGLRLPVHAVLFTQGINEDQSMANLMRTHTADQQAMNAVAVRGLRTYATAVSDHLHDMRNNSLHTNLKSVRERAHKAVVAVSAAPEADNDEFTLATSFIESPFSTRAEYEAALKLPHEERVKVERAAAAQRNTLATALSTAEANCKRHLRPIDDAILRPSAFLRRPAVNPRLCAALARAHCGPQQQHRALHLHAGWRASTPANGTCRTPRAP